MPRHGHRGYAAAESAVGDSPDRNGRAAHCVGMHHKREEGIESDEVGGFNLPVNQDKYRADNLSQRVRTAIENKTKKEEQQEEKEGPG